MPPDTKDNLKELWKNESVVRKEAQRWETMANAGFIGLVATEMPEFFAKESCYKRSAWRLPLFVASSVSIMVGVIMNWIKGSKAEEMRESVLMIEHTHGDETSATDAERWGAKITAEQNTQRNISK